MTYFVQYPWNIFRARKFDLIKQKKLPNKFDYLFSYLLAKTSIYPDKGNKASLVSQWYKKSATSNAI